jgi:hypothetical protein
MAKNKNQQTGNQKKNKEKNKKEVEYQNNTRQIIKI